MNKSKILNLWAILLIAVACIIGTLSHAPALLIGDDRDLGLINPNHPANPDDSAGFINILLDQPLGSGPTQIGANFYTRTLNDPLSGVYPDAVTPAVEFGQNITNIDLGTGYTYLLAKYDGPNYGSVLWYVEGLVGAITIPLNGSDNQYAVSHTYLYNPTTSSVPDSGSTVMLLGGALSALGLVRRRLA